MKKITVVFLPLLIAAVAACGGEERNASLAPAEGVTSNAPETVAEATAASDPTVAESPGAPQGTKIHVGGKLPRYVATRLDGHQIELSEASDRVRLVNIWATWCTPCRFEIPALIKLQDELRDRGLEVVGISIDARQAAPAVEGFVKARGINYTVTHDPDSVITEILDTYEIPTTVLLDREGTIVWYHKGVVRENNPELREALDNTL